MRIEKEKWDENTDAFWECDACKKQVTKLYSLDLIECDGLCESCFKYILGDDNTTVRIRIKGK